MNRQQQQRPWIRAATNIAAGGHLDREVRRNEPEPVGRCDVANLSDPAGNGVDLVERHN